MREKDLLCQKMEIWAKALESGYGLEEREVAALSFVPDAIGLPPSLCSGSRGEEWEICSWDIMPGVESKALDMASWSLPSLIAMAGH